MRKASKLKLSNGERFSGTTHSANHPPALIRAPSATKLHLDGSFGLVGSSVLSPYPTLVFMLHSYSEERRHCYLGLFAANYGVHEKRHFQYQELFKTLILILMRLVVIL